MVDTRPSLFSQGGHAIQSPYLGWNLKNVQRWLFSKYSVCLVLFLKILCLLAWYSYSKYSVYLVLLLKIICLFGTLAQNNLSACIFALTSKKKQRRSKWNPHRRYSVHAPLGDSRLGTWGSIAMCRAQRGDSHLGTWRCIALSVVWLELYPPQMIGLEWSFA